MAQHVRQGLTETHAMLLYRADDLRVAVEEFLLGPCRAKRAEVVGEVRRRVEVIEELAFVIETDDFPARGRAPAALRRTHAACLLRERQCRICAFFRRPAAHSAGRQERLGAADGRLHGLQGAPQETDGRDGLLARTEKLPSRPNRLSTESSACSTSNPNCAKATTKSSAPRKTLCPHL